MTTRFMTESGSIYVITGCELKKENNPNDEGCYFISHSPIVKGKPVRFVLSEESDGHDKVVTNTLETTNVVCVEEMDC